MGIFKSLSEFVFPKPKTVNSSQESDIENSNDTIDYSGIDKTESFDDCALGDNDAFDMLTMQLFNLQIQNDRLTDECRRLISEKDAKHPVKSSELYGNPALRQTVGCLNLSVRATNCLKNDNIYYLGDLVQYDTAELLEIYSMGQKSVAEITSALMSHNLYLGMLHKNHRQKVLEIISNLTPSQQGAFRVISHSENGKIIGCRVSEVSAAVSTSYTTTALTLGKLTNMGLLKQSGKPVRFVLAEGVADII